MPCYLFTYHTHGSWLPDHPRGYVKRGQGYLPCNHQLAEKYRGSMQTATVFLGEFEQEIAINALVEAVDYIDCQLHYVASDRTHLHVLVSWRDDTPWKKRRNSLKKAITIKLKGSRDRKTWLSEGSSRKQVGDQEHYDYLMTTYLPRHRGLKWNAEKGIHQ